MAADWKRLLFGNPNRPLAVTAGVVLLAGATVAAAVGILKMRDDALADARRDIANLALVVAENTGRSVQVIDLVLRDVLDLFQEMGVNSRDTLERVGAGEVLRRELVEKRARLQHADTLAIVDASGRVINASRTASLNLDVSDRAFFKQIVASANDEIMISSPARSPATGDWTVYVARSIVSKDGEFLGAVVAAVLIQYFESLYAAIDLPRGEVFVLVRRDGTTLVRHPSETRKAGLFIPKTSPWHALVAAGGGTYDTDGMSDGVHRMVAVRPLRDYPLVINVGVAPAAVLETWNKHALYGGIGIAFVVAYAAWLIGVTGRQFDRLKASRASLREQNETLKRLSEDLSSSQERLAQRTRELEVTVETMDQGLMMIDREGTVIQCNAPARRLLDLPAELMSTKPKFQDVLIYQWETNASGREEGSFEEFLSRRSISDRPTRHELKRPDGRILEMRSVPLADGGVVRTYTDITERKIAEDKVRYLAHHDDLTQLVNRVAFQERLSDALAMARSSGRGAAVLFLDLDRFKEVNDSYGHDVGDRVLAEAARRMRTTVRAIDTVARFGGDEFAIVLPFLDNAEAAARLAEQLVARIAEPFVLDSITASLGVSIGIAMYPQDGSEAIELLQQADQALYDAKKAGRGTFRFASWNAGRAQGVAAG